MKRTVSVAVTLTLIALALLSVWLWRIRATFPYNEAGRFYDSAENVVYKDSAVLVYGMQALAFTSMALAGVLLTVRMWRR